MDKIMIIDDNKDYLFSMETFLKRKGFEVVTTSEGETAVELIQKEKPGIILLDVMMESLYSGFEIWRKMNADPELKKNSDYRYFRDGRRDWGQRGCENRS